MVTLPTVLFAILIDQCRLIISSSIPEPGSSIKTWTAYHTLPEGISGALIAYNETNQIISILSPNNPWGHAYFDYNISSETFTTKKYPAGHDHLETQTTNDFVRIDDDLYFINPLPDENEYAYSMEIWSLTAETYHVLNGTLGSNAYTETPCVAKSNDNKYIFYLGGADNSAFYDTFFVYNVTSQALEGLGPSLPFPSMQMGCLVTSDDYLYVIGGEYTPNPKKIPYTHKVSNQIWSIYVGDMESIMNKSANWTISSQTLTYYPQLPFLAEVNDLLYIIGGYTDNNKTCSAEVSYLEFKNSTNNTSSAPDFEIIAGPLLPKPLCYPAGIVADYEIYLFGGQTAPDLSSNSYTLQKTWMKSNYLAPTPSPTPSPTNSPTNSPTHSPTNSPTQSPTKPTASPTASPTNSPTHSPTKAPTNTTTTTTGANTTIITTRTSSNTVTTTTTNATNTTTTTGQPTPPPTHAPTHSGNAASGSKHTTEYWVFMGLLISVSVLLLIAAAVWFFKRWRDNKRERLMFEQNA